MTLRIGSGRFDRVKSGQGEDEIRWISNRKMIGLDWPAMVQLVVFMLTRPCNVYPLNPTFI